MPTLTWGTVLTVLCVTLWLHFGWDWSNLKGEPLSECVKSPGNQWLTVGISPHQGHLANFSVWKSCRTIKRCEKEAVLSLQIWLYQREVERRARLSITEVLQLRELGRPQLKGEKGISIFVPLAYLHSARHVMLLGWTFSVCNYSFS